MFIKKYNRINKMIREKITALAAALTFPIDIKKFVIELFIE